jgi:MFS family permease
MSAADPPPSPWFKPSLRDIPRDVWTLGFVSLLMDASSEMVQALLPLYLVVVFGASMATVGLIEGAAEATASISKIFSGALSDWLGNRKLLAGLGYGLAALSKPIFPLALSIGWIAAARFIDRVGKGVRGAPRDALLADIAPLQARGASMGLRQALDTVGAVLGPLIGVGLMRLTANDFRTVFWAAVVPAAGAVALLALAVREPERTERPRKARFPLRGSELRRLGGAYWLILTLATLFALARFSQAFLVLRAQTAGLQITFVPMVFIVMNVFYALAAYPAGTLSDRFNRLTILSIGIGFLIAADAALIVSTSLAGLALATVLWGLHMGFTQGLLAALVADAAPPDLRGAAYGLLNLSAGLAALAASAITGALWDIAGPRAAFVPGGAFAALALICVLLVRRRAPIPCTKRSGDTLT